MATGLLIVTYGLAVPFTGLMALVVVGMLRERPARRTSARPSVTVVLPAHDEENVLEGTLASLSAQRYPGTVEFVVVDDRSTDATPEIIDAATARDPRFRPLRITEPSKRLSPKVNAVEHGIRASSGEIIVTTDADCRFPEGWLEGMVAHFTPGVTMVVGYVETTRRGRAESWLQWFETIDWLSLMLVSRSLTRFGWKFASSANNQAYRRDAFEAAGGFGAPGRAPSGDEDLLTQRLGRLPKSRIVFASDPDTRVLTRPLPSWGALLRQRRRWVSRYHHPMHYHPGFLASIAAFGFHSVALTLTLVLLPFQPWMLPWVAPLWALEIAVQMTGMGLGTRQLGRTDLWPFRALGWALLHPVFIATVVLWSFLRSGEWRAGAQGYRRRFWQRRWREWRRRMRDSLQT